MPLLIVCAACETSPITPDQFARGIRLCERCGAGGGSLPPPLPEPIHDAIAETDEDSDDDAEADEADTPIVREVDPQAHLEWAETRIARPVAAKYHLHGQEADDVVQVAVLALCELCASGRFDPPPGAELVGAFRGWAYLTIKCACARAAVELRGGGTFRTVRPENRVVVAELGDAAGGVADDGADDTVLEDPPVKPDAVIEGVPVEFKETGRGFVYGRTFRSARGRLA